MVLYVADLDLLDYIGLETVVAEHSPECSVDAARRLVPGVTRWVLHFLAMCAYKLTDHKESASTTLAGIGVPICMITRYVMRRISDNTLHYYLSQAKVTHSMGVLTMNAP